MLTFDIERLVPKYIYADRNGRALAIAISAAMETFCEICAEAVGILNDPDSMPAWRCDEYAWEMGAEWYDSTVELEAKRAQVRAIQSVFRKLGTKDALTEAIESVFGGGYVREWFEYSGTPYHYAVYVTSEDAASSKRNEFIRILGIVQSLRSVLDTIQYSGSKATTKLYCATAASAAYVRYGASTPAYADDTFVIGSGRLDINKVG